MALTVAERQKKYRQKLQTIILKYATSFIKYAYLFNKIEAEEFLSQFTEEENKFINKLLQREGLL